MSDDPEPTEPSNGDSGVVRRQFDWTTVPPSTAIVETVSSATDVDILEMTSLHDFVDPDAVDTLCGAGATNRGNRAAVSFEFEGRGVVVRSDGQVIVYPDGSDADLS